MDHLIHSTGLTSLSARILVNRGIVQTDAARLFLDSPLGQVRDPMEIPDMDRAADRIARAVHGGERIAIYGDYDADGICATSIMLGLFEKLNVPALSYIPHRVDEGYGLNVSAIDQLAKQGVQLIITVDNGVTAVQEIAYAASLGIDVVVTDHHEQGETLPEACAIVDPKRLDRPYPTEYCGAGVAWKLVHALLRHLDMDPEKGREFLMSQIDLVALATVADLAPLIGENRILVRAGMKMMSECPRIGLRALMQVAGVSSPITARDFGFALAPRLNAVGRTRSAETGVALMMAKDPETALVLAEKMDRLNTERREIEKHILDEAMDAYREQDPDQLAGAIVVARPGWHVGLVGLIASRLSESFYRPAFVVSIDGDGQRAKGSARSITGFNLHEALASYFEADGEFGGHAMAAGFRLPAADIDAFREAMNAYAERVLTEELLRPEILIDADMALTDYTLELAETIQSFEPFGEGNPRPILSFSDVSLAEQPRIVGNNHLRLRLVQGGTYISAIGWRMGDLDSRLLRHSGSISVAGHPSVNDFRGRRAPELEIRDIRFD